MNTSIHSGKFPVAWKTSSVVPVPKGNNHSSISNYVRSISLLPVLSKLLKKHIHNLISNHLSIHYPIILQQWGFQPKNQLCLLLLMLSTTGLKSWIKVVKWVQYFLTFRRRLTQCLTSRLLTKLIQVN
jgi:hypothetical protein